MGRINIKHPITIVSALYIISLIISLNYTFTMPNDLVQGLVTLHLTDLDDIIGISIPANISVVISLVLGLLVIILNLVFRKGAASAIAEVVEEIDKSTLVSNIEIETTDWNKLLAPALNEPDVKTGLSKGLSILCNQTEASVGALYLAKQQDSKRMVELYASYAFMQPESESIEFEFGEGLVGQVAKERKPTNISNVPEGFIQVLSGLGSSTPSSLIILPLMVSKELIGVAEIASFKLISEEDQEQISKALSVMCDHYFGQPKTVKKKKSGKEEQ